MKKTTSELIDYAAKKVTKFNQDLKEVLADPNCDLVVMTTNKSLTFYAYHSHATNNQNIINIYLWEARDLADTDVIYYLAEIKKGDSLGANRIMVCSDFNCLFHGVFMIYRHTINNFYALREQKEIDQCNF